MVQPLEREVVAQRLHHAIELADVRRLVANRAHEETPVARLQLGGGELQRTHLDARVLLLALVELVGGRQEQHVVESARGSAPKVSFSAFTCAASLFGATIDVNSGR